MDEKKLEEILIKNNHYLISEIEKKMDKKFKEMDNKFEEINNKFEEINNKFEEVNKKFEDIDKKFEDIDRNFEKIDKNFEEINQKRIHDNFYFEHTYWNKISIIFDKIQLMDQIKEIDEKENQKLQNRVELNSTKLMSHDIRISKLEKMINS